MNRSIFSKIFSGYVLIVLALSVLILICTFSVIRNYSLERQRIYLENFATALKFKVLPYIDSEQYSQLQRFAKEFGNETQTRITVTDSEGVVLADTAADPGQMERHDNRAEIRAALNGQVGSTLRYSSTLQQKMLYVAYPVSSGGRNNYSVIRVSRYVSDINFLLSRVKGDIVRVSLGVILFALLISWVFSRYLVRPAGVLSEAAGRVAQGDFDVQVYLKNRDEFHELARSFNFMTKKIKELFAEVDLRTQELRSILSAIHEGLAVIDSEDRIVFYNQRFCEVSGYRAGQHTHYWEFLRVPEFAAAVRTVREGGGHANADIDLEGREYLCSISALRAEAEMVVTFHDISELRSVERMKKNFILNVSHELRTPLTAIKGFLETVTEEARGEQRRYLEIVNTHTDRLINIVQDLLVLVEVEDASAHSDFRPVDIGGVVKNVLPVFEPRIKEKNLACEVTVEDPLPRIEGDTFKLEQLVVNLLDNAIKYTECGQVAVHVRAGEQTVVLEVKDTGIGIESGQQTKIFERFYVVDKSRSKKHGGTGLGLAIVKHIVLLHNGTIRIDSIPGKGSRFTIEFPYRA
ncbi:MAG: HAMP domain-containing protein [Candidatus Omnitrophica bacterium]|nr:HAMP domain-containing protein [Candidatus Omnitrophota bacterium]